MSPTRAPRPRSERLVVIYGITSFILVLVVCQLWLITATVNAYLGGDDSVVVPAAVASALCLALNIGLLRFLMTLDRR